MSAVQTLLDPIAKSICAAMRPLGTAEALRIGSKITHTVGPLVLKRDALLRSKLVGLIAAARSNLPVFSFQDEFRDTA